MPGQKLKPPLLSQPFTPDETDVKIAEHYSSNAQTSYLQAAKDLGLTYDVVRYRAKRMRDAGFFLESRPVLNYAALGYNVYSVLLSFRTPKHEEEMRFEETMRTSDNVLWATKTFGRWNYLAYIIVERDPDMHRFLETLRNDFPHIVGVELYPVTEEMKYSFLPEGLLRK